MSYLALALEIFWNDHRPSQLFFFFWLLEPDEPDRPRRRGQRHSLDSKLLLANFHLLKYEKGHELNRKSETVTESCLHHNITDRAVALDGWNHVLSGHRAQLSARRGESCLHRWCLMLKRWQGCLLEVSRLMLRCHYLFCLHSPRFKCENVQNYVSEVYKKINI